MIVKFTFNANDVTNGIYLSGGEWNCPFLPRIGEEIGCSILEEWIDTKKFYESLTEKSRREWDEWVVCEMFKGRTEEEARLSALQILFEEMAPVVSHILWSKRNGDIGVLLTLDVSRR